MRTLGNIIWHILFLGFISAFFHFIIGCLFVISIIGSPIGLGLIEYSKFLLAPFSKAMVSKNDLNINQNIIWKTYSIIIWIIYLPFGLIFCLISIFQIVGLFITIIDIPLAIVIAKSLGTYFNPIDKICASVTVRDEIDRIDAQRKLRHYKIA